MIPRQHSLYRVPVIVLFLMSTLVAWGGNRIFSSRVKSLTSIVNGDWQNRPVMTLNSSDVLSIGFDEFSHNYHRLVYHLDHCEATPSTPPFSTHTIN